MSQAPQDFRSSEKQATCEGCFARQCICSVIFLHSGMSKAVHPQFSEGIVVGFCGGVFVCFVVVVVFPSQSQPGRIYKGEMAYGTV